MLKIKKVLVEAIEYLREHPEFSMTKVASLFLVDRHMIAKYKDADFSQWVNNLSNIDDCYLYYFSESERTIIDYCIENQNFTITEVKRKFKNCPATRDTILRWLKIFNITVNYSNVKHNYDRNKFNKIETEEDAYWLGFFTADGCIITDYIGDISLATRDKEHLKKFGQYLGLADEEIESMILDGFGGAYTRDNPVCHFRFCSHQIIKNLKDKGVMPRKSGHEKPYLMESIELNIAYVRGLLDGDGYIRKDLTGFGFVGSYEMCAYIQNFITDNIKDISNNHIRQHGTIWKLEVAGRTQTATIIPHFYKNAKIYLDRKYELYKQINCRV